jgi:hypothetical protein
MHISAFQPFSLDLMEWNNKAKGTDPEFYRDASSLRYFVTATYM